MLTQQSNPAFESMTIQFTFVECRYKFPGGQRVSMQRGDLPGPKCRPKDPAAWTNTGFIPSQNFTVLSCTGDPARCAMVCDP